MSTEIKKFEPMPIKSMDDLFKIGKTIAESGMFGIKNDAEGFVIATTCQQQGLTFIDFLRTYHLIESKPSMKADAMASAFRKLGGRYKVLENSDEMAKAEFTFEGNKKVYECSYADIKKRGINLTKSGQEKDNYKKNRASMLWARMMSTTVRILTPEVCAGVYTPEEISDFSSNEKQVNNDAIEVEVTAENVIIPPVSETENNQQTVDALSPIIEAEAVEIDYSVCPLAGVMLNTKWDVMQDGNLTQALALDDNVLSKEYKDFINKVLEGRK